MKDKEAPFAFRINSLWQNRLSSREVKILDLGCSDDFDFNHCFYLAMER